jgi:hypothetical protein
LYQYFLPDHPGCGQGVTHLMPAPSPVGVAALGTEEAPANREWRSDAGEQRAPQTVGEGAESAGPRSEQN